MAGEFSAWTKKDFARLRRLAKQWYLANGRSLPWRDTNDPYATWVSEIMLQQTQVATVIPYYQRFLQSFPTVKSLALASLDDVYRHWAGLGYYRRARQMHEAANVVLSDHGGVFPIDFADVLALPGVGRYTAGAILSFSLDQRHPIVEANTQRLYARLLHLRHEIGSKEGQSQLWSFAESILPPNSGSGVLNQSLTDIGSQICIPKNPHCLICPFQKMCPTFASGSQATIPVPNRPKVYSELREVALVIRDRNERILIRRCAENERWAGLWDFPRFDVTPCKAARDETNSAALQFRERFGKSLLIGGKIHDLKHAVTRYRITLQCYEAEIDATQTGKWSTTVEKQWASLSELNHLALSSSAKRLATFLNHANSTSEHGAPRRQ